MALRKTLAEKLCNVSKISSQALTNCRISSPAVQNRMAQKPAKATTTMTVDPRDGNCNGNGMFRRFLHKGTTASPATRKLPVGEDLMERLREIDMCRDRIRLEGLIPVFEAMPEVPALSAQEAKKLLRAAQLEVVKSKLREIGRNWISYSDFIRICGESCSDQEQGLQYAKLLDESGNVIVLGNLVLLRSEQVAKALGGLIPLPGSIPNDPRRKELMELEKKKAIIDSKADSMVRRELWLGLAFLVVQTAGFMRLTFWELTWDVMEPICFYLTSMYFMAGYAFFLRTSKEPSFEGFYKSRFTTKQRKLIHAYNFDIQRYNELKTVFPSTLQQPSSTSSVSFHRSGNMQMGALDH
ncbi:Calcium uniporter protein 2 [Hibiscus syriacus]|uniref:Calcium uniporter protein 2 n=1 Tax=Hibiscus syriacus TaxID=106335 RepID=A0A6A2XF42_HIBSY|nr:calcium uniporter protein 2, mitochondrial-like [Hibiscus syriacus]KAE8655117.1 Calcium uniporter protein 2 [Hibiscus syriacus]